MTKLIVFVVAGLIIMTVTFLPHYLGPDDLAECSPRPSEKTGCQAVDAIVAVSGGDTNARTDEAIKLYKAGWSNLLIFSGAAADTSGPSNAEAMMGRAIAAGVPASDILTEEQSRTTEENALNTSQFVEQEDLSAIILVTSSYHQKRTSLEFGSRLGSGVKIINHPVKYDNRWSQFWWLKLDELFLAYSELAKIMLFYIKGAF